KVWEGGKAIPWKPRGGNGFPATHNARVTLSIKGVIQEGYFVDIFHKTSTLDGVPDKVSFALIAGGARVLALDENGPSDHMNVVGRGRLFFGIRPDHPHVHVPVEEDSSRYAEPLDRQPIDILWRTFLERANIKSAPNFRFPPQQ